MLALAVELVTTALAVAGVGYYLLALFCAWAFRLGRPEVPPGAALAVSILKPVKGLDPDMYAAFRSHCLQQYGGEYEILFGVSSLSDPAVEAVERLRGEFPALSIRLVECPLALGTNGKVSNLAQMVPEARYRHLIINDSDIRVSPQYLEGIMMHFRAQAGARPRSLPVGLVTAPYYGRTHRTLGSRMEALGISTDFMAGVLTARKLEGGIHFGLGSTLAVSREALEAIGGIATIVDYLADDYELGARISASGYAVALSREVVETHIPAYSFRGFLSHQIRWARSTRDSRRWGYAGLVFTFGLPWALLNVVASGISGESLWLLSLALMARVSLALAVGVGVLLDRQVLRDLWLLVPRDVIALGVWIWSFAGDDVMWRGEVFALRDGKLVRQAQAG